MHLGFLNLKINCDLIILKWNNINEICYKNIISEFCKSNYIFIFFDFVLLLFWIFLCMCLYVCSKML